MKIYGTFDNDLGVFTKFNTADNDVIFRRWLQKFLAGLVSEVKSNPMHPLAELVTDSSKFDIYDLGEISEKDGVVEQPAVKRIFCNLSVYVSQEDL